MSIFHRSRVRAAVVTLLCSITAAVLPIAQAHDWSSGPRPPGVMNPRSTAMAYDAVRSRVVVFGGTDGTLLDDTWEYDGATWTQGPAAPPALTPRKLHAMTFDLARQRVVLFGGDDGSLLNDTWIYDGAAWSAGPTAPAGLAARVEAGLTHDIGRGRTVLFGGDASRTATALRNDTWELSGAGWSAGPVAPAALTPRTSHAMAYDLRLGRVVTFGGFDGAVRNDTWLYDGTGWTAGPAAPATMAPRSGAAMTYEFTPERLVLFGGWDGSNYLSETWEWDGTGWSAGSRAPGGLEPRFEPAIAYDSARGVTVVFGGFDGTAPYFDDVWEYHAAEHYLVGAGLGPSSPNRVRMFESDGTGPDVDFLAYSAGSWGVNVATGGLDGGANDELLTGPGPGAVFGPQVRGFLGNATPMGKINYYAYGTLKFGVNVATLGLDSDPFEEIVTGAGPGVVFGPHVRGWNFDGTTLTAIGKVSYFAYGTLQYGVNVSGGDLDSDQYGEILTAPGPGVVFGPQVRGFDYDGTALTSMAKVNFNAFTIPQYGANVTGGYLDLDGFAEIAATAGPGPTLTSRVVGFDYDVGPVTAAPGFDVTPFAASLYGGRIGTGDIASFVKVDLIVAPGRDPSAPSSVRSYIYDGTGLTANPGPFVAFPGLAYGANVAAHSGTP